MIGIFHTQRRLMFGIFQHIHSQRLRTDKKYCINESNEFFF